MGNVFVVPYSNGDETTVSTVDIEFKPTAHLVIITNNLNGTSVEMTTDQWNSFVPWTTKARALAR